MSTHSLRCFLLLQKRSTSNMEQATQGVISNLVASQMLTKSCARKDATKPFQRPPSLDQSCLNEAFKRQLLMILVLLRF
eukprot:144230-Amphidinium_carterae.1